MFKRTGRARKLSKKNTKSPYMASSMLLTDESTSICPKTQIPNIKGVDASVTAYTLLPTTTADVLEEVSKCPDY